MVLQNKHSASKLKTKESPLIKTRSYSQKRLDKPNLQTENITPKIAIKTLSNGRVKNKVELSGSGKIIKNNEEANEMEVKYNDTQAKLLDANKQIKSLMHSLQSMNAKLQNNLLQPIWVTDDHLNKYFDKLNINVVGSSLSAHIMNPLISHGLKSLVNTDHLLEPLNLSEKTVIIIPVNDSNDFEKESGSHWSLLVYHRDLKIFYYYDSIPLKNLEQSKTTAKKLVNFLTPGSSYDFKIVEGPCQNNSYDCGIYLILGVEHTLQMSLKNHSFTNFSIPNFNEIDCIKKRCLLAYVLENTIDAKMLTSLITHKGGSNACCDCDYEEQKKIS